MLDTDLFVDLPSQELRRELSSWERVRRSLGADIDGATGEKLLALSAPQVFTALCQSLVAARVTDAVWLRIDDQVVYRDVEDDRNDLDWLYENAIGRLDRPFHTLSLAVSERRTDLHLLVLSEVRTPVPVGREELHVRVAARLPALRPRPGESAGAWRSRLASFLSKPAAIEAYRVMMREFAHSLGEHLSEAFGGSPFRLEEVRVKVLRPSIHQLGRFRELRFGQEMEPVTYRPTPAVASRQAWTDQFLYYEYDPYQDLLNFFLLDLMLRKRLWRSEHVHVVDPGGSPVCTGDQLDTHSGAFERVLRYITLDPAGSLEVDAAVPDPTLHGDPIREPGDPLRQ